MERIKIGIIVNTHGLKGEVKIKSFSDFNAIRFQKKKSICIFYQNEYIDVVIASFRENKGNVFVSFEGYQDINLIEKFRNCEVYVDREQLHELDEDEVYFIDLMGCKVYLEDDTYIGEVNDVLETGANAVLRVNQKTLIPYVKAFVKEADIANKKIVIYAIEGLL